MNNDYTWRHERHDIVAHRGFIPAREVAVAVATSAPSGSLFMPASSSPGSSGRTWPATCWCGFVAVNKLPMKYLLAANRKHKFWLRLRATNWHSHWTHCTTNSKYNWQAQHFALPTRHELATSVLVGSLASNESVRRDPWAGRRQGL